MSQVLDESPLVLGRDAAARHAWHEAFDLLQSADSQEPLAPEDLEALAASAWWTGRIDECIAAREKAFSLYLNQGNPRRAAVVALELAHDHMGKLSHSIGAGWFSRAERLLSTEGDCVEQGYLWLMRAMAAGSDHESGLVAAKNVLDIGTRFGDRDLQAYGLLLEGRSLIAKGEVQQGLSLLDEATVAAVSGEIGPHAAGIIYCMAIHTTSQLADYQRAGEWTEASRRWCERQSISGFPGVCRVHRAEIMRLRGAWAEAESDARRAINELQNFNLEFAAEGFYEIGEVRFRMGDLEEARDAFRQAHELGRDPLPGLALLQLAEGKPDAARTALQRALNDEQADLLKRSRLLTPFVSVAIALGDYEAARAAADEAQTIAAEFDSAVLQAAALLVRGELQLAEGDAPGAERTLRASWKLWREADLPYEAARARMLLGAALRSCGDDDGAVLELQAARTAFEKLGAVLDLRKTLELLGEDIDEGLPRAPGPATRVTKTFMFTDIVSSTNLAETLGDEAWEDVLSWHDQTMRKVFMAHCGEEVKQIGDGFFVAFEHAYEAVECAVDVQRRLAQHRKEHGFAPQVRIGLHTAEATSKDGDYGGMGVHEAARIGALAKGGNILASKPVIDAAKTRFPVTPLRAVQLKGVSGEVEVASIEVT